MTMQKNLIKGAALAIAVAAALPVFADPPVDTKTTTTTTTTTTKHSYVYYRDRDIYYSPETKTWYWMSNGTWTSGVALPADSQAYVKSGGVTIELDTMRPYEKHDYVVSHYKTAPGTVTKQTTTTASTGPGERTTTTTTTTKHKYVYYRDRDIYFAPETKTYYWLANGTWTSGTVLPADAQAYVKSGGVTIELDVDKPYERHDYVIAHYKNRSDHDDEEHH